MFEGGLLNDFSFSNLGKPDHLMMAGGLLGDAAHRMQANPRGGLLGAFGSSGGGMNMGLLQLMQNRKFMDWLKSATLAQNNTGRLAGGAPTTPMGLLGSAPLAPWGGGTY